MTPSHAFVRLLLACLCVPALATPGLAQDGLPIVQWQRARTLDTWDADGSDPELSVYVWDGNPQLLYVKNGGVYFTHRSGGTWAPPIGLLPEGAGAAHPTLSVAGQGPLAAIWHAPDGFGVQQVYASLGLDDTWEPPTPISDSASASRNPTAATFGETLPTLVVAWEDNTAVGWRVHTRPYQSNGPTPGWGTVETFGNGVSEEREPFLVTRPTNDAATLVWADFRSGDWDIYSRSRDWDHWGPESLVLDTPFDLRNPAVASEFCSDIFAIRDFLVCEAVGAEGAVEVFAFLHDPIGGTHCPSGGFWLSADDGIPSRKPTIDGLSLAVYPCDVVWGYNEAVFLPSWIEEDTGIHLVRLSDCPVEGEDQKPAPGVLSTSLAESSGEVVQVWTEQEDGTVRLNVRAGTTIDCWREQLEALTPLLLGPEGYPPTRLRFSDECSGSGVEGSVSFSLGSHEGVVRDPIQPNQIYEASDADGYVTIPIRGGGCASATIHVDGGGFACDTDLYDIRSPDIDGDCAVTNADRDYVVERLGTTDSCADINGSGLVDEEDLAIVDATIGDACSNVTGVDVPSVAPAAPGLTVHPNPAERYTILHLQALPGEAKSSVVRIVDASGRAVRSFPASAVVGEGGIRWDLTDQSGHPLPAGMYFAIAGSGRESKAPILIVR